NRGVVGPHQAEAMRDEGGILDFDGRSFRRNVHDRAMHDRTARRDIAGFIDLGSAPRESTAPAARIGFSHRDLCAAVSRIAYRVGADEPRVGPG
ncbi:7121_t:CDS:2, partial [Entrophospora sp. SA101]